MVEGFTASKNEHITYSLFFLGQNFLWGFAAYIATYLTDIGFSAAAAAGLLACADPRAAGGRDSLRRPDRRGDLHPALARRTLYRAASERFLPELYDQRRPARRRRAGLARVPQAALRHRLALRHDG